MRYCMRYGDPDPIERISELVTDGHRYAITRSKGSAADIQRVKISK